MTTLSGSIDPNDIKGRDYLMLAIINGATKANVEVDKKKESNKKACRKKVDINSED